MDTAKRMVGDTVSNKRSENDFYSTPAWAVEQLLVHEKFVGNVWECACGEGAISRVLSNQGGFSSVFSSDLINRGVICDKEVDFLSDHHIKYDNIITNPPFNKMTEFVYKAKSSANYKIAMFLKTTALEGNKRHKMWVDTHFRFSRMYQFVDRVNFGKEEGTYKNGGMMAFAWFIWDKSYFGEPVIRWIKK